MSSASQIIKQLKQIKSSANGTTLYDHIKKVYTNLTLNQQPVDSFQSYSYLAKQQQPKEIVYRVRQSYEHLKNYQIKNRALLNKINIGTQQQPQQPASLGYIPDLMEESRVFQKFGCGFGEEQIYRIFKSLARLAQKKNAKQLRLWGKILGSQKDYYICQGVGDTVEEAGQLAPDTQPKGNGINKNTYWVTTELTSDWTQLPIITPNQMQIARKIKYLFTGDLNRSLTTNPLFPGKQSHLLKCQIVRINTTCTIIPKGMYVVNTQDPKEIDSPEQYNFPEATQLAVPQNWVYHNVSILKNGRTTLMKPQGLQPEQQEKWVKTMTQKDPSEPRLKNIALDSQNWVIKSYGLQDTYKAIGKQQKVVNKGVVGVKNLIWTGWLTISYQGKFSSIYIGYGHKFKQNYYPAEPQIVLTQKQDKNEVVIDE